jgi:hypothetical protein
LDERSSISRREFSSQQHVLTGCWVYPSSY